MTTITLRPETKVPALICGKSLEESLDEVPDKRRGGDGRRSIIGSVTEARSNRLIDVEHILEKSCQ